MVLVAGFSSLPDMLSGYAIAGWVPVLRPLTMWPWLLSQVMGRVVDTWESAARWREIVKGVKARGGRLRLSMVHAKNDWDIPSHEDDKLFRAAVEGLGDGGMGRDQFKVEKEKRTLVKGKHAFVSTWQEGDLVVRQELFPHGGTFLAPLVLMTVTKLTILGHNSVLTYTPVLVAVMRSFGLGESERSLP